MQVSVEITSAVERRMTIGLPKELMAPKVQSRLKTMAHQTKHTSFSDALTQENLALALVGNPIFDLNSDIKYLEQGLSYTATFEIRPQITTLHVDGLAIEKPVVEITEADVDTMLYRLRQQRQTWTEVDDRTATNGDRIILDFVGTINGLPFKGNEIKQASLTLGQNDFILPGFEEQLRDIKTGDEREFDLAFPKDHSNAEIAGQTVHFVVNVSKVTTGYLPEIDAEFVKSFGVANGSLETLRTETRQNMERELKYVTDIKLKQQILGAFLKENPIEAPPSLVEQETQQLLKTRQQELQNQNLVADMFKNEAQNRVKLGFLIGELVKIHNLKVEQEQIRQMVERIAFAYKDPETVVKEYYADEQRLKEVESIVLENQVVLWLLERAKTTDKPMDFYSLVMGDDSYVKELMIFILGFLKNGSFF